MSTPDPSQLFDMPSSELNPIASQVLSDNATCIGELSVEKIGRSFGPGTIGIYQVVGKAKGSVGEETWSAVVKVLGAPQADFRALNMDPQVEVEVYRSGVFAELCGGVRAARCYAIEERNGLQYLWLEDLTEAPHAPWIPQYYLETARNFGGFNAHWPEAELPKWKWLGPYWQEKYRTPRVQSIMEQLPERQHEPLIGRVLLDDVGRRLLSFWTHIDAIFAQNEATTRGVCHLDCHSRNLFPMASGTEQAFTIAHDWTTAGIGPYGCDVGLMLASSTRNFLTPEQAERLKEPIFEAYVRGLHDASWAGNEDQVRLTYLTCLGSEAFRLLSVLFGMVDDLDVRNQVMRPGSTIEDMFDSVAPAIMFYAARADEASQLAKRLRTKNI